MDEGDQPVTKHLVAGSSNLNRCQPSTKYLIPTEPEYYPGDERKLEQPRKGGFYFEGEVNLDAGLNGMGDKLNKEMAGISRHIGKIGKLHSI